MKHRDIRMNMGKEAFKVMLSLMFVRHHFQRNSDSWIRTGLLGEIEFKLFYSWSFGKFVAIRNVWSCIGLTIYSFLEDEN
jgi:hypothetical protein